MFGIRTYVFTARHLFFLRHNIDLKTEKSLKTLKTFLPVSSEVRGFSFKVFICGLCYY